MDKTAILVKKIKKLSPEEIQNILREVETSIKEENAQKTKSNPMQVEKYLKTPPGKKLLHKLTKLNQKITTSETLEISATLKINLTGNCVDGDCFDIDLYEIELLESKGLNKNIWKEFTSIIEEDYEEIFKSKKSEICHLITQRNQAIENLKKEVNQIEKQENIISDSLWDNLSDQVFGGSDSFDDDYDD